MTPPPPDDPTLLEALGAQIRDLRAEFGWSQRDLADKVSSNQTFISSVERGAKVPRLGDVRLIAEQFGIRDAELLCRACKSPPSVPSPGPAHLVPAPAPIPSLPMTELLRCVVRRQQIILEAVLAYELPAPLRTQIRLALNDVSALADLIEEA